MTVDRVAELMCVSRETQSALRIYLDLLRKWSPRINLVAPSTLEEAESRHFADSLQLLSLCPERARVWADLGSGGGFPGLVVAIAARNMLPELEMHLIESDQRKATFLRAVSRETQTPVTVHAARAELLAPLGADVVSARALAPLPELLPMVHRHLQFGGIALLPKGKSYGNEVHSSRADWHFSSSAIPSKTEAGAAILKIGDLSHV